MKYHFRFSVRYGCFIICLSFCSVRSKCLCSLCGTFSPTSKRWQCLQRSVQCKYAVFISLPSPSVPFYRMILGACGGGGGTNPKRSTDKRRDDIRLQLILDILHHIPHTHTPLSTFRFRFVSEAFILST